VTDGISIGDDGRARCAWAGASADYRAYHDNEWGVPVGDDVRLFEKLSLEGFQSGLSWLTILRKREAFRAAFAGFDFRAVAQFGASDVERLLADAGIVRHRGKIEAVINNAARSVELVAAEGSLARHVWSFAAAARRPARPRSARAVHGLAAVHGPGQGPQTARLAVHRPDDRLRLHAVDGPCQRPPERLRGPCPVRGRTRQLHGPGRVGPSGVRGAVPHGGATRDKNRPRGPSDLLIAITSRATANLGECAPTSS
jgi:DNA-3-methyladenine glycosylase I